MEKKNGGKRGSEVGGGSYGGLVARVESEKGGRGVRSARDHVKEEGRLGHDACSSWGPRI
jgi:hypothetical protein